jgi:acyl-CoA dehydrogenase
MSTTYAHLTEGQRELLTRSEVLARDVLAPLARNGEPGRVNRPLVAALSADEFVRRVLGAGRDLSVLNLCLIREGLARYSTEAEIAFALQGLGSRPIRDAGRPEVADVWMPRVIAGEAVAAFALTEPDAGSDAASLSLLAELDGDGFRLTGEKVFISNAPEADIYTVFARTTADAGARGVSAFAVPGDSPGLSGTPIPFVADHPIGRLRFDGVPVPATHVLGEIDHGFGVAMRTLYLFRPSVGAAAVGMAQAALDAAVLHSQEREAFGRPL